MGTEGETLSQTIRVTPTPAYPFKVVSARSADPAKVGVFFKEVAGSTGPAYEITVSNTSKSEGRYFGHIVIQTDSKIRPELKVYVSMYIRKKAVATN